MPGSSNTGLDRNKERCLRCNERFSVVIAVGGNANGLVEAALHLLLANIPPIRELSRGPVLLVPPVGRTREPNPAIRAARVFDPEHDVDVVQAPSGLNLTAAMTRQWTSVPAPVLSQRFDQVLVPRKLVDRSRLVVTRLPDSGAALSPVTLMASFAHPRQRLAVRVSGDRGGLLELALPLTPDVILMDGRAMKRNVIIATSDLIAAEVVWLAWQSAGTAGLRSETVVPWQNPVIQRAAEMELGPLIPDQIRFITSVDDDQDEAALHAVLARVRERLGIA